jgi:hypothetical protein
LFRNQSASDGKERRIIEKNGGGLFRKSKLTLSRGEGRIRPNAFILF